VKHQATTGQYCISRPISHYYLPWSAIGKCATVESAVQGVFWPGASARSDATRLPTGKYNH
jgi:hypothetical protein